MNSNFKKYSVYYNLLYANKNYKLESDYIRDCLSRLGCRNGEILEFGSGTGIHGRIISETNYNVYGIELSPEMVAESYNTENFSCQVGDITNFNLNRKFDAIISLFHVVSYITNNESLNSLFENARKHLKKGGIFLFDVWYSPAVYFLKPAVKVKRVFNDEIEVIRIAEPEILSNQNIVKVNFTLLIKDIKSEKSESINEIHEMRHFSIPELELLAGFYGFECILTEEFVTRKAPSVNTWGVCLAFKKI